MWLSLQQDKSTDYVFATGVTHTVKELITIAFNCININIKWENVGLNTIAINEANNKIVVKVDPKLYRVSTSYLCGKPSKAFNLLGWKSNTNFNDLIKMMIKKELGD